MDKLTMTRRSALTGTVAGAAALSAAAGVSVPAQAQTAGAVFPFPTHVKDLANGLRVIVIETGFPDIVSLQIPMAVGSRNEVEPGKSGFAHFFEHMMFRGTKNIPSSEYQAILKAIGAESNAYTSDDRTVYHTTFNKEDLETVMRIEADRFQHLEYAEADFRTEALAVLGEYNKNNANPMRQIFETQREAAYTTHTYKHTTMGFLRDIKAMPDQFAYSRQFFDRYYRPEFAALVVAGDVKPEPTFALAEKYFGSWKKGSAVPAVPAEPAPNGPLYAHVKWESETLPFVVVAFRGPSAYPVASNPNSGDAQALDVLSSYAFSSSSELYQRLVVKEQKVEMLGTSFPDSVDPGLLNILAQVKKAEDIAYVRDAIQAELASLRAHLGDPGRIEAIRKNLKYSFASALDNTEAVADSVVQVVTATRSVDTLNEIYRRYDRVTPEDVRRVANKYFTDRGMIVTTLAHGDIPAAAGQKGGVDALVAAARPLTGAGAAAVKIVERPVAAKAKAGFKSLIQKTPAPLIDLRLAFRAGAARDPAGMEGLAQLTAMMVTQAGSKAMTYQQIQQALFPMAAGFGASVDKELTVFAGGVHRDNLDGWYNIIAGQLLEPGFREEDFIRVRTSLVNGIRVGLRGNNDEELGNETLYERLYAGHPYGSLTLGHAASVEKLTLDNVRAFHAMHYTQANLTMGIAGGVSDSFIDRISNDLAVHLPKTGMQGRAVPPVARIPGLDITLIQKPTIAAAISMGFPIAVKRGHPDFVALYLARSYFGEHRSSASYLFQRIREIRGMNYGDYAYTEYFPNGGNYTAPPPNYARSQQAFRIWIRPVPPEQTHFAIRIAKYELDKLVKDGISQADFDATKKFLEKSTGLLTARQGTRLGYSLDQQFYGQKDFTQFIRDGLKGLTRDKVNAAIRKHLGGADLAVVVVTPKADELAKALLANSPSPMTYASTKPADILAEDKVIERYPLAVKSASLRTIAVKDVFERDLFGG